jgi:hypothetical protein
LIAAVTARLSGLLRSFALWPDDCMTMDQMDQEEIKRRIIELQIEHRDLDAAIDRLGEQLIVDDLALRRMKKRKLQIKDTLTRLEMRLVPDIPA